MEISEYKQLFLNEAQEILTSLNNVLVEIEKDPANQALINELFRQTHTFKSMAQSMGYDAIAKLTHAMEAAMALLKTGRLKAEKETVHLMFRSFDILGHLVEGIRTGEERDLNTAPLVEMFEEMVSDSHEKREKVAEKSDFPLSEKRSEVHSVRVPLHQIDGLMDIAGELAINKIRLMEIARAIENSALEEAVSHTSRLTSQLQDQIMQIRLVPLEYIFTPYPRMVRDMAASQDKALDLIIEGSDIGLDRSIQDEINEPLLHLLKNAVSHGIEGAKERKRQGKPERGRIKLRARRERNFVVIELSDDGRGMDVQEIKEIALKGGLITKEAFSALSPKETVMLITSPGYTRAGKVTEAAGRGVGLNASRFKVESLGGTLNINTKPGKGTTFSIKLPLTMAILPAMLVAVADETYCIPLSYITEAIKVAPAEIKTMERRELVIYRDTVLPLIHLRDKFGFPSLMLKHEGSNPSDRTAKTQVVVVEMGSMKAGLVVDRILGQQEAVIKPLPGILTEMKGVSGATILGTGKVALVVDVGSLV